MDVWLDNELSLRQYVIKIATNCFASTSCDDFIRYANVPDTKYYLAGTCISHLQIGLL